MNSNSLNDQIAREAYAASSYLSMASWCATRGLRGCAGFFHAQSEEERVHMLKLVKYVNEAGGHAIIGAVGEPLAHYKSINHLFEVSLGQEQDVTKSINTLVEMTFTARDYASFNFLQWYVAEQHEEENLFTSILNILELAGKDSKSLIIVDNEIAKLKSEEKE